MTAGASGRMAAQLRLAVVLAMLAAAMPVAAQDVEIGAALDRLVAAYPSALAGHDDEVLRWRDGSAMPLSAGSEHKTFAELLGHASIADQVRIPYPRGALAKPPAVDADPGRFRNADFFIKMYGNCSTGEVAAHLASLAWLPKSWGRSIRVTTVNGVDTRLRAVSAEIDTLPGDIKRAAFPIAGTYNCRPVADTGQPSPHGYGIAIDLNTAFSDYWYWQPHDNPIVYRNRMPQEIVAIFEKHGFIWGGKWYHFDTMHFEFRPELVGAP